MRHSVIIIETFLILTSITEIFRNLKNNEGATAKSTKREGVKITDVERC